MSLRKKAHKPGMDGVKGRRKREEVLVEIRKQGRDEHLMKKRRRGMVSSDALKVSPPLISWLFDADPQFQLYAAILFREILSADKNPAIQQVIDSGVVPRFVEFLGRNDFHELQYAAAWVLTNIAGGTSAQTQVVVSYNAVPIFVQLLASPSGDIRDQAAWALGNIAGDGPASRDLVLQHGGMRQLLEQFGRFPNTLDALRTLFVLLCGKPAPPPEQIRPALPLLVSLLHHSDENVVDDACITLLHILDSDDTGLEIIKAGACPQLVKLLRSRPSSPRVIIHALKTLGSLATGDDDQTQVLIDNSVLPSLLELLKNSEHGSSVKREACYTLSNITAGNQDQIQAVINANLIPALVNLLLYSTNLGVKMEAAWVISHAASSGTHDQIKFLVSHGCIEPLCNLLESGAACVIVGGLRCILEAGDVEKAGRSNLHAKLVKDAGGVEKLDALQLHDDDELASQATEMLEKFLIQDQDEDEDEDEDEHSLG